VLAAALAVSRSVNDLISLLVGTLELITAAVAARALVRYRRTFPWLLGFVVFFVIRGGARVYGGITDDPQFGTGTATDVAILVALLMLVVGLDRTVVSLRRLERTADARQREYARALVDYRALARHRLANPIAIIHGGIVTLRESRGLTAEERDRLLDSILAAAAHLSRVALDPTLQGSEEDGLQPEPVEETMLWQTEEP
jgi:signal transduction histidine kinase